MARGMALFHWFEILSFIILSDFFQHFGIGAVQLGKIA